MPPVTPRRIRLPCIEGLVPADRRIIRLSSPHAQTPLHKVGFLVSLAPFDPCRAPPRAQENSATPDRPPRTPMSIRDWPETERPREKLLERGPHILSDAELLAVLIG